MFDSVFTQTTVSVGHRALACASFENWPADVGAAAVLDLVVGVEVCVGGAAVERDVLGAGAGDGLAGAAGGVAVEGATGVAVAVPAG
jgi:hypothetical protein